MFYKNPPLFLGYALGSYVLQRPKESKKLRVLPTWRHGEVEAFPTCTGPVGAVTGERCVGSGRRDAHCELFRLLTRKSIFPLHINGLFTASKDFCSPARSSPPPPKSTEC
ncbi:uncharacterized protein LOC118026365 isoform X1 [Mirounga leonina]|uniref:uncharacterized protein LOC118026365 isoform X1 n=1 Tax=Mirounga leonina TaxID=9715 RepID=UPI00156C55B8|nr:uncharacterized protein LOC118026365 isoform X1 [Mirounga leonina]